MGLNADEIVAVVFFVLSFIGVFTTGFVFHFYYMRFYYPALHRRLLLPKNFDRPMLDVVVGEPTANRHREKIKRRYKETGAVDWESTWFRADKPDKRMDLLEMHQSVGTVRDGD